MQDPNNNHSIKLLRRGFDLGETSFTLAEDELSAWHEGKPVLLKGQCVNQLSAFETSNTQSAELYKSVLEQELTCDELLDESPYRERLKAGFQVLGSSINEGDNQEIETVLFDAVSSSEKEVGASEFGYDGCDGDKESQDILAEDLWMKVSWLSFYDEDASLRFRFSFGVDLHEDVAADIKRQKFAAQLTEAAFPESAIITGNDDLLEKLRQLLNTEKIKFVERIVYFNAPHGGAYLHHDRERGHAGVVYAQLSGSTFWLALPRKILVKEVMSFISKCQLSIWPNSIDTNMQKELSVLSSDELSVTRELESFANSSLIHLINETEGFVQQLIANGHGRQLNAGDMLLLPQESDDSCCWHSVYTVGENTGEALSFAVRND